MTRLDPSEVATMMGSQMACDSGWPDVSEGQDTDWTHRGQRITII